MEKLKLTDICDFQGGSQPPKEQWTNELKDGYIRMLQIRDFTQGKNNNEYVKISNTLKTCEDDDILIARYGASVGKVLSGLSGAYNVALMKAVPDETQITKDYLFNFLQTPKLQEYIISLSERAAGQSGVNKRALNEYPIHFPSIPEQKCIVAILDKAFAVIDRARANAKKNQANARELFESYLNNVFANPGED